MDHLGVLADVVGPHPLAEVSLLLVGQREYPHRVLELLGEGGDHSELGQVSVAPGEVGHTVDH